MSTIPILMMMKTKSKIGLGTAAIGRPFYINIKNKSTDSRFKLDGFKEKGIAILEQAYEMGIRYFDTAPGYGMAEQMLIDWVREKDDINIEIATKWGYTYVANFDPNAKLHEVKEHSLGKLNEQWAKSKILLPLLTTYQIHSATLETGVLENVAVLNRLAELKEKHNLRIGITTSGANQAEVLEKALEISVNGKDLFDLFQVTYNIFDQSLASVALKVKKQKKHLVIKEALANGRVFPNERYPHYSKAYQTLIDLAQKYNVGVDAIALRFCVDSIPVYKVLSGAAIEEHLKDNLKVSNIILEAEDITTLKNLSVSPHHYWNEREELDWN